MNSRCASSALGLPCFSSYQCESGLACSDNYSCCSPFWGVCTQVSDCCDKEYTCREEAGFTYKRCLPAKGSTILVFRTHSLLIWLTLVHTCVNILFRTDSHLWHVLIQMMINFLVFPVQCAEWITFGYAQIRALKSCFKLCSWSL